MIQLNFLSLWLPLFFMNIFFMKIEYKLFPSIMLKKMSSMSHHVPSMILLPTPLVCERADPFDVLEKDQILDIFHSLSLDTYLLCIPI